MAATAVRVFGKPITHGTRSQRALEAKNYQNAGGKLDQMLLLSNQLQKEAAGRANFCTVSTTFGRIYNATGGTITCKTPKNWKGSVVGKYPEIIENGQWVVFEHVGTHQDPEGKGSVGAVVYNIDDSIDSIIAWNNPWKTVGGNNTAYCDINYPGFYDDKRVWNHIQKQLMRCDTLMIIITLGYATKVTIDEGVNTPIYTVVFYLDDRHLTQLT